MSILLDSIFSQQNSYLCIFGKYPSLCYKQNFIHCHSQLNCTVVSVYLCIKFKPLCPYTES